MTEDSNRRCSRGERTMLLADRFAQVFRDEHRKIRDTLLDLLHAFNERNRTQIQTLLNGAAAYTGPHFRYEEESLYPALVEIFGQEYIDELYRAHDRAIGAAKRLIVLAGKDELGDGDVTEAKKLILGILPHVSDCEGLSIMVEKLPNEKVQWLLETRERSLQENLDLIRWSEEIRGRATIPAA